MTPNTFQKRTAKRTYKLRGTVVGLDLVHRTIVIQPSVHDGKRVRRLSVLPDSEILAGDERKTLADLVGGDWVTAQFVKEEDHEVLKREHPGSSRRDHPSVAGMFCHICQGAQLEDWALPERPSVFSPCDGTLKVAY